MEQTAYHVVREPDPEGGHVAVVPAFPGCHSQGETAEEALSNAREAILSLPALPRVSGREAARAFASLGYEILRQRGSHLRLGHPTNARLPLTGPDRGELKTGLLRALIRDAGMSIEEFVEALRR